MISMSEEEVKARMNLRIGMVLYNPCWSDPKCRQCDEFRKLCRKWYHQHHLWPQWVKDRVEGWRMEKARTGALPETGQAGSGSGSL